MPTAVAAAATLVLTGCASGQDAPAASSTSADSRPYASVVSKNKGRLAEVTADLEVYCGSPDNDVVAMACVNDLGVAQGLGSLTRKGLDEAASQSPEGGYEVAGLLPGTLEAADALRDVELPAACDPQTADVTALTWYTECSAASRKVQRKAKALLVEFAAWEPYGA